MRCIKAIQAIHSFSLHSVTLQVVEATPYKDARVHVSIQPLDKKIKPSTIKVAKPKQAHKAGKSQSQAHHQSPTGQVRCLVLLLPGMTLCVLICSIDFGRHSMLCCELPV